MSVQPETGAIGKTPTSLIPAIERKLYGNQRTQMNRLDGGVTSGQSTLTFGFSLDGIRPGAYLELDEELAYVWSTDQAELEAEVQRGMLGTEPKDHDDGTVARVEPRFLRSEILEEIGREIRSWPTNVYARYIGNLQVESGSTATDVIGLSQVQGATLIKAQIQINDGSNTWLRSAEARIERRQDQLNFPTGYALVIPDFQETGRNVRVRVRVPFTTAIIGPNVDLGLLGVTPDLADVIPWGVAGRMLASRDAARTDANAQGRSRPAEEVRTGDAFNIGQAMLQVRNQLLAEAANRLLSEDGMGIA